MAEINKSLVDQSLINRMIEINQMPVDEQRYAAICEFPASAKMIALAKENVDAYIGLINALLAALPTDGHREASLIEIGGTVGNADISMPLYAKIIEDLQWCGRYHTPNLWPEAANMAANKWSEIFREAQTKALETNTTGSPKPADNGPKPSFS